MNVLLSFRKCVLLTVSIVAIASTSATGATHLLPAKSQPRSQAICTPTNSNQVSCDAVIDTIPRSSAMSPVSTIPIGFGPTEFHQAYKLPTQSRRKNPVIAIVGAYDNPNSKSDLDVYNQTFGLPYFPNCGTILKASCYQKVTQAKTMSTNQSWIVESSLDVQTSHQICQNCKIILVEASTSNIEDMIWANDKAVSLGANVVNNSWGRVESAATKSYDTHFKHPGVTFVASSGDSGYNSHYPASSPYFTAVGGTSLLLDGSKNWLGETAWAKGGSNCSINEPKPVFQKDSGCSHRSVVDVSADADDEVSGAAIYDSFGIDGVGGWLKMGGTSLSAPLISGVYGLAAAATGRGNSAPYLHGNASNLHDVQAGANGTCITYLCQAGPGYDGPTGLGTPNGLTAFQ